MHLSITTDSGGSTFPHPAAEQIRELDVGHPRCPFFDTRHLARQVGGGAGGGVCFPAMQRGSSPAIAMSGGESGDHPMTEETPPGVQGPAEALAIASALRAHLDVPGIISR